MPVYGTSLSNLTNTAVSREIASNYDKVKIVAENIEDVIVVANASLGELATEIAGVEADIALIKADIASGGLKGDTGETGETGAVGPIGLTGATGPQGIKGDTGSKGEVGPAGINGTLGGTPIVEFSVDVDGNLQYEIVGINYTQSEQIDKDW